MTSKQFYGQNHFLFFTHILGLLESLRPHIFDTVKVILLSIKNSKVFFMMSSKLVSGLSWSPCCLKQVTMPFKSQSYIFFISFCLTFCKYLYPYFIYNKQFFNYIFETFGNFNKLTPKCHEILRPTLLVYTIVLLSLILTLTPTLILQVYTIVFLSFLVH